MYTELDLQPTIIFKICNVLWFLYTRKDRLLYDVKAMSSICLSVRLALPKSCPLINFFLT